MSTTLAGVSKNVTGISCRLIHVDVSNNVTEILSDLAGVSNPLESNGASERIPTFRQEVWNKCPSCTTAYYKILAVDLTEKYVVYCSFEERCGTAGP